MKTALLIGWLAAYGGDATTSHLALARGGVERNTLMPQNPTLNTLLLSGEGAGGAYLLHTYWRKHPRWAFVIASAGIGLETYATVHNLRTLRHQR